ncbi:hypothetical protein RJ640_001861 [Escallonia rubra]|uniref:Uncharacterized protein n=1 Tax=Escallonia rubra TaxID=112253 RepID=A0AA88UTH4_9ASTE|nr:hypothetical protein RJ640_001861 [Escallonia rubra]
MFGKVQLSPSSYDTAWVAMVPSRGALKEPMFPESVDWIMQNQHPNGSWGLNPSHPLLVKDSLSSTLACLLALQKWKVGEQLVQKGLDFIGSNRLYVNEKNQPSPIGFDIVFPGMVSKAIELGLNLPLDTASVDKMLSNAEQKVKSNSNALSLPKAVSGTKVILHMLLKHLVKLIVGRRCWQQRNEEIFLDVTCCASAFQLLRMHGYEVGSDALAEFIDEEHFFSTVGMQYTNTSTILELYKASQVRIFQREPILEKIHGWTRNFLKSELLNRAIYDERLRNEVEYALEYSIHNVDRVENRRSINLYDVDKFAMLKTSHRWVKDTRMDQLELDWHALYSSHFMVASVHFSPELSDARIAWSKISVIGTILDDMFDIDGPREELLNIIELVEKWDEYSSVGYNSERNKIVFSALYDTINDDLAPKAFAKQGRLTCTSVHVQNLEMIKCMLKEVEWWTENLAPGIDEYIFNGTDTVGCGIYSTVYFFLGPELSENVLSSEEYANLYYYVGRVVRPLNDYRSDERESIQRKLNLCSLLVNQSNGSLAEEDARDEVRKIIEYSRREVLRMMLQTHGSLVPKAVKESIWKLSKLCHYLYARGDEFRTPGSGKDDINIVFYEPINLSQRPSKNSLMHDNHEKASRVLEFM